MGPERLCAPFISDPAARGYGPMRELRKKWMTGQWKAERTERIRTEELEETAGAKGTWEPLIGVWKAEHWDWQACKNYCIWAFEASRRKHYVRFNKKNKRVEFKHEKDVADSLVRNKWSLVHTESMADQQPDAPGREPAGGAAPLAGKEKQKPSANARRGKKDDPVGVNADDKKLKGGRTKPPVDLKLNECFAIKEEYKSIIGDGRDFLSKVQGKTDGWADLSPHVEKMGKLISECEEAVDTFGHAVLLHEKKEIKGMFESHQLLANCDSFSEQMEKPLSQLRQHTKLVFGLKRFKAVNEMEATKPPAKKARGRATV